MTIAIWAVVLGLAAAAAAAALSLLHLRRSQRQMAALAARLESLEARWLAAADPAAGAAAPGLDGTPPPIAARALPDSGATPAADVLSGLTTHVQQLLADGCGTAECLADRAILAIFRRLGEPATPSQLADDLYVSVRTLERGLALALECTPRQLLAAVKMREARRLLLGGGLRVADVAERVGYSDPFHFSRQFKAFWGVSPSAVRPAVAESLRLSRRS